MIQTEVQFIICILWEQLLHATANSCCGLGGVCGTGLWQRMSWGVLVAFALSSHLLTAVMKWASGDEFLRGLEEEDSRGFQAEQELIQVCPHTAAVLLIHSNPQQI